MGFDVVQLLPLNDSGQDPSPYDTLSSCALNPIYLSLHALPYLEKFPSLQEKLTSLQDLTKSPHIAYTAVWSQKKSWLLEYFEKSRSLFAQDENFARFCKENPWLKNYGCFIALKEKYAFCSWKLFPKAYQSPSPSLHQEFAESIAFHSGLQYLCASQLRQAADHFHAHGVFLIGDIPILVSLESVDVWENPEFFDFSLCAGAPPDFYNPEGQYWGFPLYNWEAIEKDDFSFWKRRLQFASSFYDIFRLDHIVGFFRIWAIQKETPAKSGFFLPKNPALWLSQGEKILKKLLSLSSMLPIGEDLGTIPEGVRPCMESLGICGTKVMRWERFWDSNKNFIPVSQYPRLSLTCVSTHDSLPLSLWWRDFPEEAKLFAEGHSLPYTPDLSEEMRFTILLESHHSNSLFHINLLPEYLAFFKELSSEEERINTPGVIDDKNWAFRLKVDVDTLSSHKNLKEKIQALIR